MHTKLLTARQWVILGIIGGVVISALLINGLVLGQITLLTDDFESYALDQPITAPWQEVGGSVSKVTTGKVLTLFPQLSSLYIPNYLGQTAIALLNSVTTPDLSVKTDLTRGLNRGWVAGAILRYTDVNNFYAGVIRQGLCGGCPSTPDGQLFIVRVQNGVGTLLAQTPATLTTAGTLEFKASGNQLELFYGSSYATVIDTAFPTGQAGLISATQDFVEHSTSFDNVSVQADTPTSVQERQNTGALSQTDTFDDLLANGVVIQSQVTVRKTKPKKWSVISPYPASSLNLGAWDMATADASQAPLSGNILRLNPLQSPLYLIDSGGRGFGRAALAVVDSGSSADISVKTDFTRGFNRGWHAGAILRYTDANNFYAGVTFQGLCGSCPVTPDGQLQIYKVQGGVLVLLAQTPATLTTAGTLEFKASGNQLELFYGPSYVTVSDSALASGKAGLISATGDFVEHSTSFDNVRIAR